MTALMGLPLAALGGAPTPVSGTELARELEALEPRARQAAMVEHVLGGRVPAFLLETKRVRWVAVDGEGVEHSVEILALRDYLAVGTDRDFLRVPLDLVGALEVAQAWHMVLPTPLIVDAIYARANERLAPAPMGPDAAMSSVGAWLRHRALLRAQGGATPPRGLRAGHKKDLVLSPELEARPGQVAIYGWHSGIGQPIQPVSLWHGARYHDYSHGVRLLSRVVLIDGVPHDFYAVWSDGVLWPLISREGPWPGARRTAWAERSHDGNADLQPVPTR